MPKVLRIINRFNLGGISYNVSYLSKFMPEEYETRLIGGPEEEGEESSLYIPHSLGLAPEIILELRRSINPFGDYFAYKRIKRSSRNLSPILFIRMPAKLALLAGWQQCIARFPLLYIPSTGMCSMAILEVLKPGSLNLSNGILRKKARPLLRSATHKKMS